MKTILQAIAEHTERVFWLLASGHNYTVRAEAHRGRK